MENKHKNALIGALLAVVFVMAVGYAAFSQTLTINGTAEISSTWDVRFDNTKTTDAPGVVTAAAGLASGTTPTGSVSYADSDLTANVSATLYQPGDTVTFVLTIKNDGSINATLGTPAVSLVSTVPESGTDTNVADNIVQVGNIIFTVTGPASTSLNAGGTTTITVKAEFDTNATSVGDYTSATIEVTTLATQA